MPVTARTAGRARWFSGRALALHVAVLIATPSCVWAAWWQVHRALSGNGLSWAYTFEWPAFAGLAVWVWWVLLHLPGGAADPGLAGGRPAGGAATPKQAARQRLLEQRRSTPSWEPSLEGPRLRAYNAYLAGIQGASPRDFRRIPRPAGGGHD